MKIIVAPDSFKNSMTAKQATDQIINGLKSIDSHLNCIPLPMADGGEGTMSVLMTQLGGTIHKVQVKDALGRPIDAQFGINTTRRIAVIDMASASGIEHLKPEELNPLKTSTFGTGQLIQACLKYKPKEIFLGVGGSATNDGGVGAATALGYHFFNDQDRPVASGNQGLAQLTKIEKPQNLSSLPRILVFNDVANPLLGENGASKIFGPQKGATPNMIIKLENNLAHLSRIVKRDLGTDYTNDWGTGSAGGLGFGLKTFFDAKLVSGINKMLEVAQFEKLCQDADFVITGEGSFDTQSKSGKVPFGIAKASLKWNSNCQIVILAGKVAANLVDLPQNIRLIKNINDEVPESQRTIQNGQENIRQTARWLALHHFDKN